MILPVPGADRREVTPTDPGDDRSHVTPTDIGVTPSDDGTSANAGPHLDATPDANADAPVSGPRRSTRAKRQPSWFTFSVVLILWALSWLPL